MSRRALGATQNAPIKGVRLPRDETDLPVAQVMSEENFAAYNYKPTMGCADETLRNTVPLSTAFSPPIAVDRSTTVTTQPYQLPVCAENLAAYNYQPTTGCAVETSRNTAPPSTVFSPRTAVDRSTTITTQPSELPTATSESGIASSNGDVEANPSPVPKDNGTAPALTLKRSIFLVVGAVVLLFVAAAIIGTVCGSGNCSEVPPPSDNVSNSANASQVPNATAPGATPSPSDKVTISPNATQGHNVAVPGATSSPSYKGITFPNASQAHNATAPWAAPSPSNPGTNSPGASPVTAPGATPIPSDNGATSPNASQVDNTTAPGATLWSSRTLSSIQARQTLNCGIAENLTNLVGQTISNGTNFTGFNVDLCKALAAAIFGSATGHVNYNIVTPMDRFVALNKGDVDVIASSTTHTMEREIYEPTTKKGYSFSTPYLYGGLKFGGVPPYGACANNLLTTNTTNSTITIGVDCTLMRVCVLNSSTYVPILMKLLPGATFLEAVDMSAFYNSIGDGSCNVLAGDEFETAKATVESAGYFGAYEVGDNFYSKEPLAMVTRQDDGAWSDFVNWIIIGLLSAEEQNITQARAIVFANRATAFGDQFQKMFSNAVAEVGHYGEIYSRNLEAIVPRSPVNKIRAKNGTSGLIYAMPFGSTDAQGTEPVSGSTLRTISERGFLRCGIARRPIFGVLDESTGVWSGFDVDFCRALSAAIFNGMTNTTEFTDLDPTDLFVALARGDVDVLSRLTTVTLERDVFERDSKVGFSFSQPAFYDGVQFGGIPLYLECAETLNTAGQCAYLRICVSNGTTSFDTVRQLFPERFIVATASSDMTAKGLVTDMCNAICGGVVDVSTTNVNDVGFYNGLYKQGSRRFSKDPLALVTRQDDPQWSAFVYWIVSAIFYAEETGVTSVTASSILTVNLFGALYGSMFRDAIAAVGSYAEIYARNAETESPRPGLNTLNTKPLQAQHDPLPGVGLDTISYQA